MRVFAFGRFPAWKGGWRSEYTKDIVLVRASSPVARFVAVLALAPLLACAFEAPGNDAPAMLGGDSVGEGTGDEGVDDDDGGGDDGDSTGADASDGGDDAPPSDGDADDDDAGESGGVQNDCPRVRVSVSAGKGLNVRPSPSTEEEPIGSLPNHAIVDVLGEATGELIQGTTVWFHIADADLDGFVSGAYAECTFDEPPDLLPPDAFWLPLECGTSAEVSQGNFGDYSHQGNAAYAFDFALGVGTPMVAMADGIVIHRYAETHPGDPCWDGGDADCYDYANLVTLLHGDGTTTIYKHLSEVLVSPGEFVPRATVVGLSGSTGYSTGPHAHVMRQEDCGMANCQSIPMEFADAGVPEAGEWVTSANCG